MPPIRFPLVEFQDGRHATILDIGRNNFSNSESLYQSDPPIKFWLNPTYGLGGDVLWRISRPLQPSWILEWNEFSNSESLSLWCLPSGFGSIQLTVWEEMSLEAFQDGGNGSHLGYCNGTILAILNLCYSNASHQVSAQSNLWFLRCRLKNFKMAPLDIKWNNFAILNLYVTSMPPIKFRLNPTYGLRGNVLLRISKWPPWWPYWISEQNDLINSESPCSHNASHQVLAQSDLQFWRRCQQWKKPTMDRRRDGRQMDNRP